MERNNRSAQRDDRDPGAERDDDYSSERDDIDEDRNYRGEKRDHGRERDCDHDTDADGAIDHHGTTERDCYGDADTDCHVGADVCLGVDDTDSERNDGRGVSVVNFASGTSFGYCSPSRYASYGVAFAQWFSKQRVAHSTASGLAVSATIRSWDASTLYPPR